MADINCWSCVFYWEDRIGPTYRYCAWIGPMDHDNAGVVCCERYMSVRDVMDLCIDKYGWVDISR